MKVALTIGMLVLVALTIGSVILIQSLYGPVTDPGMFGDMFGGVNALLSGLALIGVVITLLLQRRALDIQWREVQSTQLLTTAGILFEYYNAKISSLNVAIGAGRNDAENIKARDDLLEKHKNRLTELEERYEELLNKQE